MRHAFAALLLSLATSAASAQTAQRPAEAAGDTSYVAALEALDRGSGQVAVQLLDGIIARLPADAHAALHEAQLRLAESYLVMGQPDSADALIGRAWAELELAGPPGFNEASDERLVQFIERVATAGRADLAFRLALMREARAGIPRAGEGATGHTPATAPSATPPPAPRSSAWANWCCRW